MSKKGYEILASNYRKEAVDTIELNDIYAQVKKYASNPNPANVYELGQLIKYTATDILNSRLNWVPQIADTKNGAEGDKPEFITKYSGVVAKVTAKGATPEVSQIKQKSTVLPTVHISARPKIEYQDLVQRPEMLMEIIEETVIKMENQLAQYIQNSAMAVFSTYTNSNYKTGANIVQATLDGQLQAMQRISPQCSVIGDVAMLSKLSALVGYTSNPAPSFQEEINNNRFVAVYKQAKVVELTNRFADETSIEDDNLVLRKDLLAVVPSGNPAIRPIKVFLGGTVQTRNATNFEDGSMETIYFMEVGVGVIGNQKATAFYKDTTITA